MRKLKNCLESIGKKPGMGFGFAANSGRSLSCVSAFITGFQYGQESLNESLRFDRFTQGVAAHYRVIDGAKNVFCLILDEVGGDEHLAFDEFFRLLPVYSHDYQKIGADGIIERYTKVMMEIRKKRHV
jgi:hypothetical protein